MDGGQIWIALESSGGVSSKDVTSVSVTHVVWEEEIMRSKMENYQNQNGILNRKVHSYIFHNATAKRPLIEIRGGSNCPFKMIKAK